MDLNHYRFHSEWSVGSDPQTVYRALIDLPRYARWWPEFKSVIPIAPTRAVVLIMGLLPYSLEFVLTQEEADPQAGTLRASLNGDLDGWSSWRIRESAGGCILFYDQEVDVRKRLLRVLAPLARPVFRLNHRLMMRRGRRGLNRYLAEAR